MEMIGWLEIELAKKERRPSDGKHEAFKAAKVYFGMLDAVLAAEEHVCLLLCRPVRNPYDISKIAGGSSSGSASLVSAGLCLVALGVDGGGSVRMPTSLCSVVGLKPTFARIPHDGYAAISGEIPYQKIFSVLVSTWSLVLFSSYLNNYDVCTELNHSLDDNIVCSYLEIPVALSEFPALFNALDYLCIDPIEHVDDTGALIDSKASKAAFEIGHLHTPAECIDITVNKAATFDDPLMNVNFEFSECSAELNEEEAAHTEGMKEVLVELVGKEELWSLTHSHIEGNVPLKCGSGKILIPIFVPALRTLCLAFKDINEMHGEANIPDSGYTLVALVGIKDPVRPGVKEADETCKAAAGDNIHTAEAIAKECSILTEGGVAIEGPTFRDLSSEEMMDIIPRIQVMAGSLPLDKYKLVNNLRSMFGDVVVVIVMD
ncbi:uncharacterized protein LOC106765888 [Vigna radiata var. radiata]|uniref:Uncharacterized protein LOC106765888 n=1 Tax=Vigna radiata var. radiata TaxID=3916 RepID=A0A3Q0F7Z6_VIGRR|nr:uncharacterized protein LOC106765888 [Vigna radiata var. radiata]